MSSTDLFSIEGYWDGQIKLTDCKTKQTEVLFDPTKEGSWPSNYPDVSKEPPNSSRVLWKDVVAGIKNNSEENALEAKRKIEAVQRKEENERIETKTDWVPVLFVKDKHSYFWYKDWDQILDMMEKEKNKERLPLANPKRGSSKDEHDPEKLLVQKNQVFEKKDETHHHDDETHHHDDEKHHEHH